MHLRETEVECKIFSVNYKTYILSLFYICGKTKEHMRLVHLEMSHFGENIEPPCHVFHVIIETFSDKIFRSYFDRTLIQMCTLRLRHKPALNF